MFAIQNKIQLNWGSHIAAHMKKSRHLQFLPFGYHISYLIKLSGIDLSGETVVPPRTIALIDRASLGKLDLGWNPGLGSFDYMSDHTVKVRRPKGIRSKPPSSSDPSRHRSSGSDSISEKIDHLTSLVMETNSRLDRLEALVLRLIPGDKVPSPPQMDTDVHSVPGADVLVNTVDHQGVDDVMDAVHHTEDVTADVQVDAGMSTEAHISEADLEVDNVQDLEPESEAQDQPEDDIATAEPDTTTEPVADPEAEATKVVREVLASLTTSLLD